MEWNGRQYRPAGQLIRNTKPDFQDMMRPYGQKRNNGNVWVPVLSIPGNVPQPSSGPTPFDPSSITGLKLWFDAEDTNTLSLNSGLVESWTSKGDVPLVLTASTSTRRPQYITTGGTGSSPAVLMLSSSTVGNRSLLTQQDSSQSFNLTSGYTVFWAFKNSGTKTATGVYGSYPFYLYNFGNSNTFVNQAMTFQTSSNITDNLRTGATTGFALTYQSPGASTPYYWSGTAYTIKYVAVDYNDLGQYKFYGQDIYSGSPAITNAFWSFQTSYTGKTINGMGIGGTNTAGTPSALANIPEEIYEILVYDRKLSTNDANQVMDYLRSKWDHVVDTSNLAIFDVNYTGKTSNVNDNATFVSNTSPSYVLGNSYMGGFGMKYILGNGVQASFVNNLPTANTGVNYTIKDSGNNIIESASCYKSSSTTPITYSAGTYSMDIEINYNCVDPSPTPTATVTLTPSPTPTMTPTPSGTPFDSDAASYLADVISAGGSVDATMSAATNTLFTDLKSNGLYTKLRAFYPMLGATSGSTSIMGKRVSGTTYDLTWTNVGSITFDASGATGNGSTTYGDTNFDFSTEVSSSVGAASHFSVYLGTNTNGPQGELGCRGGSGNAILIAADYNGFYYGWQFTQGGSYELVYSNTDSTGMYIQSRTSVSSLKGFRNNVLQNTVTLSETKSAPNVTIKVMGDGSLYSDRRFQFVTIGEGLDDTEVGNLDSIVNTFQTTLGRNVY